MKAEEFVERASRLVEQGEKVLATRRAPPPNFVSDDFVDSALFYEWKAAGLSFLLLVFGDRHPHFSVFQKEVEYPRLADAQQGVGVLKAAKADIEHGFVGRVEELVAADVFSDFLEMAEHLIDAGYKDAAASLGGAVLEDGLRRIASKAKSPAHGDLASLNRALADASVYSRLVQKQVHVWNDIRNNAAHGRFAEYAVDDVKNMIAGVRNLLSQHL